MRTRWHGGILWLLIGASAGLVACSGAGGNAPHVLADTSVPPDINELNTLQSFTPDPSNAPGDATDDMPTSIDRSLAGHVAVPRLPQSIGQYTWRQLPVLPGSAAPPITKVAVSGDGTIFALDNQPATAAKCAPADTNIWHFDGYVWSNTNDATGKLWGCASSIAVDPAYGLLATFGTKSNLAYLPPNHLKWTTLVSSVAAVASDLNFAIYVLSNRNPDKKNPAGLPMYQCQPPNYANGTYSCPRGRWTAEPGLWTAISGTFDANLHTLSGANVRCTTAPCTLVQNGAWMTAASGRVYYFAPTQTNPQQLIQLSGLRANSVAATQNGVYAAMGVGVPSGDEPLNYFDYTVQGWSPAPGMSGIFVAAQGASGSVAGAGGNGEPVYVVKSAGAVWTPLSLTIPMQIKITANAHVIAPQMMGATTYIYVVGNIPGQGTNCYYLKDATSGTMLPCSGTVAPIRFYASPLPTPGSTAVDETSQTILLPVASTARIYISKNPLTINGPNFPAPWNMDGTQTQNFDFIEYAWGSVTAALTVDTSQVNMIGLDLQYTIQGTDGTSYTRGMKPGALSQIFNGLIKPSNLPWSFLATSQWPQRILAPDGLAKGLPTPCPAAGCPTPGPTACPGAPDGNPNPPTFANGAFLDCQIEQVWLSYQAPNYLIADTSTTGGPTLYGQVDANENFQFYLASPTPVPTGSATPMPLTTATPYVTIPNPFHNVNGYSETATQQVVSQNGAFVQATALPNNAAQLAVYGQIGNTISTAINRGILGTASKPGIITLACGTDSQGNPVAYPSPLFPGASYQNQYAAVIWSVVTNPTYGYAPPGAYSIPYADKCNLSTTATVPGNHVASGADLLLVQINNF